MAVAALSLTATNLFPVDMSQVKEAPAELKAMLINQQISKLKASTKLVNPVTKASDLVGGYTWTYEQASTRHQNPDSVETTATGTVPAAIYDADDEAGTVKMAGLFDGAVEATLNLSSYSVPVLEVEAQAAAYSSSYGECNVRGIFYFEGNSVNAAGWYYTTLTFFIFEDQIIEASNVWIVRVIKEGQYANYSLTPYWKPSSIMDIDDASNAVMDYTYNFPFTSVLQITEDENCKLTINNFSGIANVNPVYFTLAEDHTWAADETVLFTNTNGSYVLHGYDANGTTTDTRYIQLTGTGDETTLTFGTAWTGYDATTNYWLGNRTDGVIKLVTGEFVYPVTPAPEPIITLDTEFGTYNEAQTVHVTVENMPEGGSIKYQLEPSTAKAEWMDYNDETGIEITESSLLTVAVFDANGEELTSIEGEYTISPSTAIETISATAASNTWYNLQGVKFNGKPAAPGIYINGGKKVIIK